MNQDDWRLTFAPPWRERLADGTWHEYGPVSIAAFARHLAKYRNYLWRPASREARRDDAELLCSYMRPDGDKLRDDVPKMEMRVYLAIYEAGHSTRYVAREFKIHRSTVRTYLRRLRERAAHPMAGEVRL